MSGNIAQLSPCSVQCLTLLLTPDFQKKNLMGAVSDLQQDAEGGGGGGGGKAKLFGGRWKKKGNDASAEDQAGGGGKSIFGGRWKKPSPGAAATAAQSVSDGAGVRSASPN